MDVRSAVVPGDRSVIDAVRDTISISEQQKKFENESGDKNLSQSQKRRARLRRQIVRSKDIACRVSIAASEQEESYKTEIAELKDRYSKSKLAARLEKVTEIANQYKSDRDKLQVDHDKLRLRVEKYERAQRDNSAELIRNFLARDTTDRSRN